MQLIFLVIQIILAVAIIGMVLLHRTGGDSLGSLGGSSGLSGGNIISGRTSANFLTKATTILMIGFMVNSLILGNLAVRQYKSSSIVEKIHTEQQETIKHEAVPKGVPVSQ